MNQTATWVNTDLYPFQARFFETPHGTIHYIDEGKGPVLLFVHGTPTWSFLYRNYIKALSKHYRCIALDHLGFGLSEKPPHFAGTPPLHAENLTALIQHLELKDINLVVHDFGGSIGLSYALQHPNNISKIVLFNTWLWETASDKGAQKIDGILNSTFGRLLYLYSNFSPKFLLKQGFHNKKKLSKTIHQHYQKPFSQKQERYGLLNMGKALVGCSDWYQQQWEQIHKLQHCSFLILWGMNDAFITPPYLERWTQKLPHAQVHQFEAGHFVQEEQFDSSLQYLQAFLAQ